ncbi:DnaT-like ssDNA-binding protein [Paracoccus sp. DMF]|uniref:DnaT-like ssDNA-binding protein n=1 Tax=Paracoccus sp. DMF TaxID=400837 RepID=UPI0021E4A15E|nr:DnaT-like ssDNA-binding protein [Paracoccus sp. DMF]MCV2448464.1 hypothetical protein [Paracoccus sp. DMF]
MPLSMTELAVTADEARDYTGQAGLEVVLHETDLMRGQRYIAARYNSRWLIAFDNDAAPDAVKFAIIEAALVEQKTPGALSPNPAQEAAVKRVKAGSAEIEYMDPQRDAEAAGGIWPTMLRGLVCNPRLGFAAFVV